MISESRGFDLTHVADTSSVICDGKHRIFDANLFAAVYSACNYGWTTTQLHGYQKSGFQCARLAIEPGMMFLI